MYTRLVSRLKVDPKKKPTFTTGIPQPFNRQAVAARPVKPMVAQLKSPVSAQSIKRPVAPPVYRPQPVPKVLQTKSSPTPKPQAVQARETAVVPTGKNVRGSHGTVNKSSVVQRASRHKLNYPLDYVLPPDPEMASYAQHVRMRTRHLFSVVLNAVTEMQNQRGKVHRGMFSDHAEAQEGKGFRPKRGTTGDKLDAAHLMNATLRTKSFPRQTVTVKRLHRLSAATTTQFQKANVGPDKLIDSQQTKTKNAMLGAIPGGAVVNRDFIRHHVTNYLRACLRALTVPLPEPPGIKTESRATAMRTTVAELRDIEDVVREIMTEVGIADAPPVPVAAATTVPSDASAAAAAAATATATTTPIAAGGPAAAAIAAAPVTTTTTTVAAAAAATATVDPVIAAPAPPAVVTRGINKRRRSGGSSDDKRKSRR